MERIYIFKGFERFWHWTQALLILAMLATGFEVHGAWKLHYDNIMHSMRHAYYQGWDLNPGQLPVRYAAVDTFFLSGLQDASVRLNAFLNKAAQATLVGNTFDDAATGQGLLNFFLRGMACGAITEREVLATGITLDELRSRSFVRIVNNRAKK